MSRATRRSTSRTTSLATTPSPSATLAASYARKSDEDSLGIDDQMAGTRERAAKEGYVIPQSPDFQYGDDNTSGRLHDRAEFNRLIALVESGDAPFTRLYVKDRSRFGRWSDPRAHHYYEFLFEKHGVLIRYCNEPEPKPGEEDTGMRFSRFFTGAVGGVVATEERENIIRRTQGGLRSRLIDGFYPCSQAPYGTRRWLTDVKTDTLVELLPRAGTIQREGHAYRLTWADDGTPELVREMFEAYAAGEGVSSIARSLNARGFPPPCALRDPDTHRGALWRGTSVRQILQNRIYTGDLLWGDNGDGSEPTPVKNAERGGKGAILYEDFLPGAPVSRELWERVASMLAASGSFVRHRRAVAPGFLLTSLLKCARCGAPVFGFRQSLTQSSGAGPRRIYYRHGTLNRHGDRHPGQRGTCTDHNCYVRAEAVDAAVLSCIDSVLQNDRLAELALVEVERRLGDEGADQRASDLTRARENLQHLTESLGRASYAAVHDRTAPEREAASKIKATLGEQVEAAEKQVAALEAEVQSLQQARTRVAKAAAQHANVRAAFADSSPEARQKAVRMIVEGVRVDFDAQQIDISLRALGAA